jgi:predicted DNA-binding protein
MLKVKNQSFMTKEKQVAIRMDEGMYGKLKKLADKDKRYLSDFIRLQLEKLIK